jgi:YD repeat-containing protein
MLPSPFLRRNHTHLCSESGEQVKTIFPSTLSETYRFDLNNNLISRTDRNNNTIRYSYDFQNSLHQKTYPDNSTLTYIYDPAERLTEVDDTVTGTG